MSLCKFDTKNLTQWCLENWVSFDLKVESGELIVEIMPDLEYFCNFPSKIKAIGQKAKGKMPVLLTGYPLVLKSFDCNPLPICETGFVALTQRPYPWIEGDAAAKGDLLLKRLKLAIKCS